MDIPKTTTDSVYVPRTGDLPDISDRPSNADPLMPALSTDSPSYLYTPSKTSDGTTVLHSTDLPKEDAILSIDFSEAYTVKTDAVDHPAYYTAGGVEAIDVIEAWELDFCLGNAVTYIARAGKKDPEKRLEDLAKARWYLDREMARLSKH